MIRRLALAAGALAAATFVSACQPVPNGDTVATINGRKLTTAQLRVLSGGVTSCSPLAQSSTTIGNASAPTGTCDQLRGRITEWLRVGGLGGDLSKVTDLTSLEAEGTTVLKAAAASYEAAAKADYEKGVDGATMLCLRALLPDANTKGSDIMAALQAGMSFPDAVTKFTPTSPRAQTGGIVTDSSGNECQAASAFGTLVGLLQTAKAKVGVPVLVADSGSEAVLLLRPYDELSANAKSPMLQAAAGPSLTAKVAAAHITVDPRFGKWDPAHLSVVALDSAG